MEEKFEKIVKEEFLKKEIDFESFKEENKVLYETFAESFKTYSSQDIRADMPINCTTKKIWIENILLTLSFYKQFKGEAGNRNLLTKRILSVLALYFEHGLGKNSTETRRLVRTFEGLTDKELNSITMTLRQKGFLIKGKRKESDNCFCEELEFLKIYYDYVNENNLKEININFKFLKGYE